MNRLREAREALDLTQEQISETLGIPQGSWSNWERGAREKVPATVIYDLADMLNWNAGYLLGKPGIPKQMENRMSPRWAHAVAKAVELGITPDQWLDHVAYLARIREKGAAPESSTNGESPTLRPHDPD